MFTQIVEFLIAAQPIMVALIVLFTAVGVPLLVWQVGARLSLDQQRFVYDAARAGAQMIDMFDDLTQTDVDNKLKELLQQIERQLGKKLKGANIDAFNRGVDKERLKK